VFALKHTKLLFGGNRLLIVKGGESLPEADVIKTPSYGLNYVLGGGFWTGRYHILWGNPQAGKSTFALHVLAEAQTMGYTPVIVDAEGSMTDEWIESCGIDVNDRIVIRSTILEEIMPELMKLMNEPGSRYVFLIDSLNTIVGEAFYNNQESSGAIGMYARSQGALIQKISNELISSVDHMVIFIAQQTIKNKGQYFVNSGKFGNAAEHWATNIVRLSTSSAKDANERDADERITHREVTWKVEKSKQGPVEGTKGTYWFSPDHAEIDVDQELFHLAVRNGIIKKGGAWYTYGDLKAQGTQKFLDQITDEAWAEMWDALQGVTLEFDHDE